MSLEYKYKWMTCQRIKFVKCFPLPIPKKLNRLKLSKSVRLKWNNYPFIHNGLKIDLTFDDPPYSAHISIVYNASLTHIWCVPSPFFVEAVALNAKLAVLFVTWTCSSWWWWWSGGHYYYNSYYILPPFHRNRHDQHLFLVNGIVGSCCFFLAVPR